ncbi:MAG TPA: hypothetical protein VGX03_20265 [Candidatus Binatia bacterium]|nr:hypothetical protein [Candidatus Binatia bacterium]
MKRINGRALASEWRDSTTKASRLGQCRSLLVGIIILLAALFTFFSYSPGALAASQSGVISLQVNADRFIPGNLLEITYHTSPGTLSGKVDIYFSLLQPTGQLLFLQSDGTLSAVQAPFRSNATVVEETKPLFSLFPVYIPFGKYTASIVMLQAGGSLFDPNAYASSIATATFSFTALTAAQEALIAQRGKPEFLTTTWAADLHEKRDSWLYVSSNPTLYLFVNGVLQSQTAPSGSKPSGTAPSLDPSLLTPQTTLAQLTDAFGTPSSVETDEEDPEYQRVNFTLGLEVVLLQGYLSAARTFAP